MDTKALRQKILDLAIRGKLVPQDPNDEPASVLLERIRAEKQQMVKDGKLKAKDLKNDSVIFVGDDNLHYEKFSDGTEKCVENEIHFEIPSSWMFCRLGDLFTVCSSKRVLQSEWKDSGIPFYRAREIVKLSDNDSVDNELFISEDHYQKLAKEYGVPLSGDLMVSGVGTIGKTYIVKDTDKFYYKDASVLCFQNRTGCINSSYAKYLLESTFMQSQMHNFSKGSTVDTITISTAVRYLCILPPVKEQERIVATINNLLSLNNCIDYELNNLKALVTNAKSKILDLAIRGKLVPQDPNDEPASILLEHIRKEKEELIKSGKLKRDKRESVIFRGDDNSYYETIGNKRACIDSEIHYDIPEGWTVERLKNLYSVNPKNDIANDETIVSFVPMNLINDRFLYNCTYELKQWKDCKKGFTHFADGDLGFAKISPCFENRKSVVFSNLKNGYGAGTTELYILRNFCEGLNPEYAILFLKSESFIERGVDTYSGTVGQQRIDKNIMMDTIIPIPPQNEQQRIADRVKQLFSILDSIQATIV